MRADRLWQNGGFRLADCSAGRQRVGAGSSTATPGSVARTTRDVSGSPNRRHRTSRAGKTKRTGKIDVAVIQSLYRGQEVKDFVANYGHIIVDECHHLSAVTFEKVMREAKAKYVIGLTATPTRKDGHHPIMYMQCGPVRFSMTARAVTDTTPFSIL